MTILAVVSDLHTNSTVGLCAPSVEIDDGGTYRASKAQLWIWSWWIEFWEYVDFLLEPGEELWVIINGDAIDGDHHNTPQIISRNMATQHKIAIRSLEPMLARNPKNIWVIRGTEAHVGKSGQYEELLAMDIGTVPEAGTKNASWFYAMIDCEGVVFDVAHHGRAGTRYHTRQNTSLIYASELSAQYAIEVVEGMMLKGDYPDVVLRADRHFPIDTADAYPIRYIGTPSWQISTAFGHRIGPGSILPIGGAIFTCRDGVYDVFKRYKKPRRSRPWKSPSRSMSHLKVS